MLAAVVVVSLLGPLAALAHPPGITTRVSVDSAGNEANFISERAAISADGRFVAFASQASNLVPGDTNNAIDIFAHDRLTGTTERVSVDSHGRQGDSDSGILGTAGNPAISADGRLLHFRRTPRTSSLATRTVGPTSSYAIGSWTRLSASA